MTQSSLLSMCEVALGCGIAVGIVVGIGNLIEVASRRLWPEKPPARHVIQIADEDGWIFRRYRLTSEEMGRLVSDLDRIHPH